MDKENLKYLYKKFSHFEDPNIIRRKIDEYISNSEIERCKNIIKNYKIRKLELENRVFDMANRLMMTQSIKEVLNSKDYINAYQIVEYNYPGTINHIYESLYKLNRDYEWSKHILKEHYKNKRKKNNKSYSVSENRIQAEYERLKEKLMNS